MTGLLTTLPPLLTVSLGILLYQVCLKRLPALDYPFSLLALVYTASAVLTLALSYIFPSKTDALQIVKEGRYGLLLLSAAPVVIEVGYLWAFRAGWKMSLLNVGISAAGVVLALLVGFVMFKERVTTEQLIGIALCVAGVCLATKS